jgi:hypothetical protein
MFQGGRNLAHLLFSFSPASGQAKKMNECQIISDLPPITWFSPCQPLS